MGCGSSGIPAEPEGNRTGRKVFCVKFQREMPGLDEPPFDNERARRSSTLFLKKPGSSG